MSACCSSKTLFFKYCKLFGFLGRQTTQLEHISQKHSMLNTRFLKHVGSLGHNTDRPRLLYGAYWKPNIFNFSDFGVEEYMNNEVPPWIN